MQPGVEFTRVAVAGGPAVEFCVDPQSRDPIVPWLLEHDWIDEPVMRAFRDLLSPGIRVLDLGCHIGLFSLPAAAAGAEVIAVDANAAQVRLLKEAAAQNGFDRLQVVHGAVSDLSAPVEFIERSIHGHVRVANEVDTESVMVSPVGIDALLKEQGWDSVDLIKMDIEGAEPAALRTMSGLFAGGARPPIVFECNASMLANYGGSSAALRGSLLALGYELAMIDHLRPGLLVEAPDADVVQTESACDLVAFTHADRRFTEDWKVEPPLSIEQTVTRIVDVASSPDEGTRRYGAELIGAGPKWLKEHPLIVPVQSALAGDLSDVVRSSISDGRPRPCVVASGVAPPRPGGVGDLLALAIGAAFREPSVELDRLGGARDEELVLKDLSLHVRPGQFLVVLSEDRDAINALMRGFAGLEDPVVGSLSVGGPSTYVVGVEAILEPELSIADNFAIYAAFCGCHTEDLRRRIASLADQANLSRELDQELSGAGPQAPARIALTVALACTEPGLLLLADIPALEGDGFRAWVSAEISRWRSAGGAVLQSVRDGEAPIASADRALVIDGGLPLVCGHVESVVRGFTSRRGAA